jgi:SAM-dependent methyltransferase
MKSAVISLMEAAPAVSNPVWKLLYPRFRRDEFYYGDEYEARDTAFDTIYQENRWGSSESRSGDGSTLAQTKLLRAALPRLLRRFDVRRFLDAPCGDFHWMQRVDFGEVQYIGADIVPALVEDLAARYAQPGREFRQIDIVQGPIPDVDMWLCRDTLFHLPNDDVRQVLRHAAAHARYFLATTYPFARANRDVRPGGFRFLNLEAEPFGLPPPMQTIDDFAPPQPPRVLGLWSADQLKTAIGGWV